MLSLIRNRVQDVVPLDFIKARQDAWKHRARRSQGGRESVRRSGNEETEAVASRSTTTSFTGARRLRSTVNRALNTKVNPNWPCVRSWIAIFTGSLQYRIVMALSIVFNSVLLIWETDMRAGQRTKYWEYQRDLSGFSFAPPSWMVLASNLLILLYVVDLVLRLYVYRGEFFSCMANNFDLGIVSIDCLVFALEPLQNLPSVAVLRMARLLRIVRVLRNFLVFRELYLMMQGLVSAIRSIIFATVLITVVLILWSIMAVEFVHLRNMELADKHEYGDCDGCMDAFSSVTMSALTFLKGIIAGDSWGLMSIPLMVNYPETAFVLLGSLLMIQLGLLNLIVAVIVDRAAVARENDEELKFTEKQEGLEASYSRLKTLFSRIDVDGGGSLSLAELQASYDSQPEFREILDLMDIRHQDLELVFDILDRDGDNEVSYQEFVEQLHEVKTLNSHTALIYIKHFSEMINLTVTEISRRTDVHFEILSKLYHHTFEREFEEHVPHSFANEHRLSTHSTIGCDYSDDTSYIVSSAPLRKRQITPSGVLEEPQFESSKQAQAHAIAEDILHQADVRQMLNGLSGEGPLKHTKASIPDGQGSNGHWGVLQPQQQQQQQQQHHHLPKLGLDPVPALPKPMLACSVPLPPRCELACPVAKDITPCPTAPMLRLMADPARSCNGDRLNDVQIASFSEVVKEVGKAQRLLEDFFKAAEDNDGCRRRPGATDLMPDTGEVLELRSADPAMQQL